MICLLDNDLIKKPYLNQSACVFGPWVLEQACRQAEEWRQRFGWQVVMTMNVNLSGKQLQRSDSVDKIRAVLSP